ncbi:fimbria/pilus outer membrane usher protein [Stenotrophomonas maltophilia]|uniref:fimbria/pilus outer membrane usher protein n=1 Tax=Stenotrophomonas maltophilia TaxID=40324 RepID=UPI00131033DE
MNSPSTSPLRQNRLAAAVLVALLPMAASAAPALEFNADLLHGGIGASLDMSRFERDGPLPGTYSADIIVNGVTVGRQDIEVRSDDEADRLCLSPELFDLLGVDTGKLDAARAKSDDANWLPLPDARTCEDIGRFIPAASLYLDTAEQTLDVSVPQAYLQANRRGWVAPDRWDHGVNALLLNYSVAHNRNESAGQQTARTSASIDAGLNLGQWRIRHSGYYSQDNGGSSYQASRSYAQRELRRFNAQLTVGESATAGDLFDAVNFTGASISTDPRMLPDELSSYAPVVRGVAQTNARVVVRQRDYVILETNVAPGPFEIDDLGNASGGGDLDVEVIEADGRVERFVVPYAAVPRLLRQGQQRSSVTVGTLRTDGTDSPAFAEATLRRGVGSAFTAYGGALMSDDYHAIILGGALNTRIGAFSGDVTFSDTRLPKPIDGFGDSMSGHSIRMAYSRNLGTSTNLSLAAYRYSSKGYLSLNDAARLRHDIEGGVADDRWGRQRSRLDLTVNHRFAKGSLFLSGSNTDYWNGSSRRSQFSLGYNGKLGRASYSISARRTLESSLGSGGAQKQSTGAYFTLNVPLGRAPAAPRVNVSGNVSDQGTTYNAGLTGSFGEHRQGTYNLSYRQSPGTSDVGALVNYQTPVAMVGTSWNRGENSQQLSLSARGGMVLHADGLTLSQHMGESVALVQVPGARGAGVGNLPGVKVDRRGYAVLPNLISYRANDIVIDPLGLPEDVELKTGSAVAVPTAGAVAKVVIPTASGRSALIEVAGHDGTPLPFGLDVYDEAGQIVGVVGQGSRLWVRGLNEQGQLRVYLDAERTTHCAINYDLSQNEGQTLLRSACEPTSRTLLESAGAEPVLRQAIKQ